MAGANRRGGAASSLLEYAIEAGRAVREYLTVKLLLLGIGFVVMGFLAGNSIWAGLLPLWGVGLIIVGGSLYVVLWYIRRPSGDTNYIES